MKANYFVKLTMAMVAVFSLASCGEEVVIDDNGNNKPKGTVFAAGPVNIGGEEGTRTTLTKLREYLWQFNDQIWVNDNGTWRKSSDSELHPNSKSANFYFDKVMTEPSYEVLYAGYNSTTPTQVKIPAEVQSNHTTNIGQRGDCGIAIAERQSDGTYKFELLHKASYLGIAPLKTGYLNKNYKWTKIEIYDAQNKPIAGTFGFGINGIDTLSVTSPSSKITLSASDPLYLPNIQSYNSNYDYIYTVIPPVTRTLYVKYYFVENSNPTEEMFIIRRLNRRKFVENNVVQFRHAITPDYYNWDAPKSEPFSAGHYNFRDTEGFVQAENSCATMPNANELYWYLENGDPRWDNTTTWTNDGGASYHAGGVWIKKKAFILAEGKTFDSNTGKNGLDMRTTYISHTVASDTYTLGGKPDDNVIYKYFFLPALGNIANTDNFPTNIGIQGRYWSSSSLPYSTQMNSVTAYHLYFDSNKMYLIEQVRRQAYICGNGSDWFK